MVIVRITRREGATQVVMFPTASGARRHVQRVAREIGAHLEGTGDRGDLVTGQGGDKRLVGCYRID